MIVNSTTCSPTPTPRWSGMGTSPAIPLFFNRAAGDFHEQSGSSAIDAGDPADAVALQTAPNGSDDEQIVAVT